MDYIQSMSAPALIWDAMFNITKVELELIQDTNLYLLSEKGIRGGVSNIYKKYGPANNI